MSAVASGEAEPADVAAQLEGQGISRIEDLLDAVRQANRKRGPHKAQVPLTLMGRPRTAAPGKSAKKPIQPRCAVLLNGTLYDPKDFATLAPRHLHFMVGRSDTMLAFDDHDTVVTWWRLNYLESLRQALDPTLGCRGSPSPISQGRVNRPKWRRQGTVIHSFPVPRSTSRRPVNPRL